MRQGRGVERTGFPPPGRGAEKRARGLHSGAPGGRMRRNSTQFGKQQLLPKDSDHSHET